MKRGQLTSAKWVILVTIMVALVIDLGHLLREFQQALHDIPH